MDKQQTGLLLLSAAALGLSAFALGYYSGYKSGSLEQDKDEDSSKTLETQPLPLSQVVVQKDESSTKADDSERVTLMLMICCVICILVTLISLIWIIFKVA